MWQRLTPTPVSQPQPHQPWQVQHFALPAGAAGSWLALRARTTGSQSWWAKLEMMDAARGHAVREAFLGPIHHTGASQTRATLVHVPPRAVDIVITLFGPTPELTIEARPLSRAQVAWRLVAFGLAKLPRALRGARAGRIGRVRTMLGQAPMRAGEAPPYAVWVKLAENTAALTAPATEIPATILLWPGPPAALAATQAALAQQTTHASGGVVLVKNGPPPAITTPFVVLLVAGEIPAQGALAAFAATLAADAVFADYDHLDAAGQRTNPVLRPAPEPLGVQSGLFARGIAMFRAGTLPQNLPATADAARLLMALPLRPGAMQRIPTILCHRRPDCPAATDPDLAAIVAHHLASLHVAADVTAQNGLISARRRFKPSPAGLVSIIIPSAALGAHVLPCLRAVIANLGDIPAEILLVISAITPNNQRQAAILRAAESLPGVRILNLNQPDFNYARANNAALPQARGQYLLFLNDDVAPQDQIFLPHMLGHLQNPDVIAVGARLLYGNGDIQHGGVTLGLGGLAEHTGRLEHAENPGPGCIFHAERAVSAVTGACLLVRRDDFLAIGGFAERYAIALNDVDLCLRLGAAGRRIIYAPIATLMHYEQVSLGRHYQGARKTREQLEVGYLQADFAEILRNDPYYHPGASREPGREWAPGFPP